MNPANFKPILILFILIFASMQVTAGTLTGTVTDHTDGEKLLDAIIKISPEDHSINSKVAVSDMNGSFKITGIPDGIYTIQVSYVGFTTWTDFNVEISETEEMNIDVTLVPIAINMNTISVSASRRPEKILEAPASVSLVESEDISAKSTLTPTEHIKGLPGVDVASTGLGQSNVVVRGFNNIFSGSLLVLTDNRIARVPSLRFNAYNFIPTVNSDIDRIEIVSGPGSALYGPNSATGVMHILTKSPFQSQGTVFSIGGGERDVAIGSIRHAGLINENIAYKISGQYYQGSDWESYDANEPDSIVFYSPSDTGKIYDTDANDYKKNLRNFDIEKIAGSARFDFLLTDDSKLILNGGYNQASQIELTGLGAGQAIDWTYYYAQARYTYKDLFIQGYINGSDAGDTYLLRTGQHIDDKSKLIVGQVQHSYTPNEKTSFIYGIDLIYTRPNTEGTINGRNEENDNINEIGGYLQGDYKINDKFKLVGAVRIDDHNRLEDIILSPRGALVFQPDENNNFRLTYNRAFATPDNNSFYLDILQEDNPFGTNLDVRVQGVPETGFHWNIINNTPQFQTPLYQYIPNATEDQYFDLNSPTFMNIAWAQNRTIAPLAFAKKLVEAGHDMANLAPILTAMDVFAPTSISGVGNTMMLFDQTTESFNPINVNNLKDIDRLKPTITQTLEFGYKGLIGNKFQVALDVYRTQKNDFIGPLTIETPTVHLNPQELIPVLTAEIGAALADPNNAADAATLAVLDNPAYGGNGNGNFAEELIGIYASYGALPFGTVTTEEQYDPSALLVTYRNFGDITFYGGDIALAYHLSKNWSLGGSYSYVSKNFFNKEDVDGPHDVYLNAPKHKFGLNVKYTNPKRNLQIQSRLRFVDSFKMYGPYVGTEVPKYTIIDLDAGVDIVTNTRLSLSVQNVLNKEHIEFVGAPKLGRLAILRLTQTF